MADYSYDVRKEAKGGGGGWGWGGEGMVAYRVIDEGR